MAIYNRERLPTSDENLRKGINKVRYLLVLCFKHLFEFSFYKHGQVLCLMLIFLLVAFTNTIGQSKNSGAHKFKEGVFNQKLIELKGFVYDENNHPLEFVSVAIPSLHIGTHTDHKGAFLIQVQGIDSTTQLVFRYVNKESKSIALAGIDLNQPLVINLKDHSLTLKDVQVQGFRERVNSNSSIIIDREAIEQSQAFSLAEVLQMLPGKKTEAPDLQHPQTLTLRTDATDQNGMNNSFGVAIFIDGVRISNDANMQARSLSIRGLGGQATISSKSDGSFDVPYNGLDLRDIPVENIERIEVIQGVADARYGDLTNGAILITTRAGASPTSVSLKINGGSTQATLAKGVRLGGKLGALNFSGGYTYSNANPRDNMKSYSRVNGSVKWSVDLAKGLSNSFNVGFDKRLDDVKVDPDDGDRRTFASGHNLNFSNSLNYQPTSGILRRLNFTASYSRGRQESYDQWILNAAVKSIADKDTTGIYKGYFVPGQYLAVQNIIGIPITASANLDLTSKTFLTGTMRHQFKAGGSVSTSGNNGPGIVIDPTRPRWSTSSYKTERPVDYSKLLPFLTNVGLYLQDNINGKFLDKSYGFYLGIRADIQNGFYTYQPRLSWQYQILKDWGISLAYGESTKAPALGTRYPAPTWLDIPLLNLYTGNADQSLYLVYTRQVKTDNADLKPAKSKTLEFALNYHGKAGSGSITAYAKRNYDGFTSSTEYIPITLPDYDYFINEDKTISYYETGDSSLYAGVSRMIASNGGYTADYGFDLMFTSKEIEPLATKLSVSSGLVFSKFDSRFQRNIKALSDQTIRAGSEALYAIYNGTTYKNTTWNSNLSAITHIPKLGFTITLSADLSLLQTRISPASDMLAIGYINRAMQVIDIAEQDRGLEKYAYLKDQQTLFAEDKLPFVYSNFNVTIAKEIRKKIRLTIRGYNIFNIRPEYNKPGTNSWTYYNTEPSLTAGITFTL